MSYLQSDDYALHHVEIRPQVIDTPDEVIQGIRDAKFIMRAVIEWFLFIKSS